MKKNLKISVSLLLKNYLLENRIPEGRIQSFIETNDAGEAAIAFECLCENLHEFDVAVTNEIFKEIETLGAMMKLDSNLWAEIELID